MAIRRKIYCLTDYDGPLFTCDPGTDSEFRWQPIYLNLLNSLCRRHRASVVVISERRFEAVPPPELAWNLADRGETWRLPAFTTSYPVAIAEFISQIRTKEDADFLIIDDDIRRYAGASEALLRRLVLCGNRTGFNARKYSEAIKLAARLENGTADEKHEVELKEDDSEY